MTGSAALRERDARRARPQIGRSVRGLVGGLVVVGIIGFIDLITGRDFGFAFFYFIPIVPVAWSFGRWPGLIVAAASAAMWFLADAALNPDQALGAVAWNAASRLAIFLGGVYLLDRVRQDRTRMRLVDTQRDEFLQVLEHELPSPARQMVDALNEAQARGTLDAREIESLRHQAEALLFLTRDFVALGQAQAQRLELRIAPVDVAQLVTEIARQRPDHDSVLVTIPGDGLVVSCDPDRLRQALSNALAEVVAGAGAMEYVSMNVRARGADALVTISAATPMTATRVVGGEELRVSLQLARLLMEAMGGGITVEQPALGRGTRVTARIPIVPHAAPVAPLDPTPARPTR
jgi:signal transduction histidine kinase